MFLLADHNVGEPFIILDSPLGSSGLNSVMSLLLGDNWCLLLDFTSASQRTVHTPYISRYVSSLTHILMFYIM